MKKVITQFVILLSALLLVACSNYEIENRLNYDVADFQATNQNNQSVKLTDLKGKVWISDFMFTSCSTVCPTLTTNMAKLQKMMKDEDVDVTFVSFSVDPEVDTPERLNEYSGKFTSDLSNWHFLTGYKFDEIKNLALNSFKALVQKNPNESQVMHGTSFYLVDQEGKVVKFYKGNADVPYEQIIKDAKSLLH